MVEVSMELRALADRVEALTGPDRDLDALIAIEIFDGGADHLDDARYVTRARRVVITHQSRPGDFAVIGFSGMQLRSAPAYTASLDAAMTLVPKDAVGWRLDWSGRRAVIRIGLGGDPETAEAWARTVPLAISAAALRARASVLDSPHTKGDEA